jgi:hypothetical protein
MISALVLKYLNGLRFAMRGRYLPPLPPLKPGLSDKTGMPLAEIARTAGHRPHHIRSRMRLAFLSPKIQRAICTGTQPADLCLERLVRQHLPLDWAEQERQYGFA